MRGDLSDEERERYDRQIGQGVLTESGQERLKGARALVTRVGGLGGPAALALAAAGVGRIVIAQGGALESPDLNRQILGSEAGLGLPRAEQFTTRLRAMNRFVQVEHHDHEPSESEALAWCEEVDIVLSCAADFEHRMRLSRAAHRAGIAFIDAAQWGMVGTMVVSDGRTTPCLSCLYPAAPPFEEKFPVIGALSAAMGNLAALEAIKILSGAGSPMWGKMLVVDGFRGEMRKVHLRRRQGCPHCSLRTFGKLSPEEPFACAFRSPSAAEPTTDR